MDYMDYDVKALTTSMPQHFSGGEVKCLMQQLLSAVAYMHDRWIIHRDLKPSNLLMEASRGRLCVCDFGLARKYGSPLGTYTHNVVTQVRERPATATPILNRARSRR